MAGTVALPKMIGADLLLVAAPLAPIKLARDRSGCLHAGASSPYTASDSHAGSANAQSAANSRLRSRLKANSLSKQHLHKIRLP
jgi:hypothetical protein